MPHMTQWTRKSLHCHRDAGLRNGKELIPTFEAEKIDQETLLLLDDVTLTSLIPIIGLRFKIQKYLKNALDESIEERATTPTVSSEQQHRISVEQEAAFNIRDILLATPNGRGIVDTIENKHCISLKERQAMVRILVSHLIERFGENPSAGIKVSLASSVVEQFPCLKDCQGKGNEAWFSPGRYHRPATGFLEERLRNVRKRVEHYMKETSIHRAKWIRDNGTKTIMEIFKEYPRLLDTPGMISQDFLILNPDSASKLTENWVPVFKDKILQFASTEKQSRDLLSNVELMSAEMQSDVALQVLPVVLPTSVYKIGRKTFKPTFIETRKAFIDIQPIGTNMAEYLRSKDSEFPHVLMMGDNQCFQAFAIINGEALEQNTLLAAVDVCFKAFYVFDIDYPKQCSTVWQFLQTVVYGLPGDETPTMRVLRAFIFADKQ
ncbi:hypothetical protein UPYG_G00082830 [Umbra pygmaea]|uniref:Uncharacterized protein n=1 Tax=Umbra pygmaea TaxID=75934 RepID=A0ABD0XGT2_UMBPY